MNYIEINDFDIANGPGIRVSLFVSGCTNCCKGCFNPESWSFAAGSKFDDNALKLLLNSCNRYEVSGLSLLGGDPLAVDNRKDILRIVTAFRERFKDSKTIWIWTGHIYEDIIKQEYIKSILKLSDILIDGPFVESLKDLSLQFRGSKNQRILDCQQSLKQGNPVSYNIY